MEHAKSEVASLLEGSNQRSIQVVEIAEQEVAPEANYNTQDAAVLNPLTTKGATPKQLGYMPLKFPTSEHTFWGLVDTGA